MISFVKFLFLTLILLTFSAYAKEYDHPDLQDYVGYSNIYEHPRINRSQIEFLNYYLSDTGPWHDEINIYLRTGFWYGFGGDRLDQSISELDDLLEDSPKFPKDLILLRGQYQNFLGRHYRIGEEFEDKAFFSTTTSLNVARRYSGYSRDSFVMLLYFGENPAKGLVLNNLDKEVLLSRGYTFKVMDSAKGFVRRYGLVQICPKSGCKAVINNKKIRKWWKKFKDENLLNDRNNQGTLVHSTSEFTEGNTLPYADV